MNDQPAPTRGRIVAAPHGRFSVDTETRALILHDTPEAHTFLTLLDTIAQRVLFPRGDSAPDDDALSDTG